MSNTYGNSCTKILKLGYRKDLASEYPGFAITLTTQNEFQLSAILSPVNSSDLQCDRHKRLRDYLRCTRAGISPERFRLCRFKFIYSKADNLCISGNICFEHDCLTCSVDSLTLPVAEYDHTRGYAIVGGAIYRGDAYSGLKGLFIVADFCTGHVWGVKRLDGDQA